MVPLFWKVVIARHGFGGENRFRHDGSQEQPIPTCHCRGVLVGIRTVYIVEADANDGWTSLSLKSRLAPSPHRPPSPPLPCNPLHPVSDIT